MSNAAACAHLRISYSGDVNIAYQVIGTGPFDLVWIPPGASNVELQWEFPEYARFVTRLASFCRVIVFDKRAARDCPIGALVSKA